MPYGKGVKAQTQGVSPKAIAATIAAVATYLLGQELFALPVWVQLICQVLAVAGAAWLAPPGRMRVG